MPDDLPVDGSTAALIEEGVRCTDVLAAKVWRSKVEVFLRKTIMNVPEDLKARLEPILGDIQSLSVERTVDRLYGRDAIVDIAHRDQVIDLLKLVGELISSGASAPSALRAEPQISSTTPKRRRGPRPDMAAHREIAKVVAQMDKHWSDESVLEEITAELDRRKVSLPKACAKWHPPAHTWERALAYHTDRVRKRITYSLEMATRDQPATPGTPS